MFCCEHSRISLCSTFELDLGFDLQPSTFLYLPRSLSSPFHHRHHLHSLPSSVHDPSTFNLNLRPSNLHMLLPSFFIGFITIFLHHPSSYILHPSSYTILRPTSFFLHPSTFIIVTFSIWRQLGCNNYSGGLSCDPVFSFSQL